MAKSDTTIPASPATTSRKALAVNADTRTIVGVIRYAGVISAVKVFAALSPDPVKTIEGAIGRLSATTPGWVRNPKHNPVSALAAILADGWVAPSALADDIARHW